MLSINSLRKGDCFTTHCANTCERRGKLVQPAGADAVLAALVFLHGLEADADQLGEAALGQAAHDAAQPAKDSPASNGINSNACFLMSSSYQLERDVPGKRCRLHALLMS